MFFDEQDIQPAIDLAEKIFGPQNQLVTNRNQSFKNVSILTREYGKIWVGDIDLGPNGELGGSDLQGRLDLLSNSISQGVYLTHNDFYYDIAMLQSKTGVPKSRENG